MSLASEVIYNDGFIDGEIVMIDLWDECVDNTANLHDAALLFAVRVQEVREAIESL
jgi:hypothetical protein